MPRETSGNIFLDPELKKRVAFVRAEGLVEDAAQDQARAKMAEDDPSKLRVGAKELFTSPIQSLKKIKTRVWKHNWAREYREQKAVIEARSEINKSGSVFGGTKEGKAQHDRAMGAIVSRFTEGYSTDFEDVIIEKSAGEEVKRLNDQTHVGSKVKKEIETLIKFYAEGTYSTKEEFNSAVERRFEDLNKKLDGQIPYEILSKGAEFANNLFDVAEMAKDAVRHGVAVDRLDMNFEVIIGQAKAGVRTENERKFVDKAINKLKSGSVGTLINETSLALVTTSVLSTTKKLAQGLARSKTAAWATFGASAVVGSAIAGKIEAKRQNDERRQSMRENAQGAEVEGRSDIYEMVDSSKLLLDIESSIDSLKTASSQAKLDNLIKHLNEANSRIRLSNAKGIDLIRYTAKSEIETERKKLNLARAKAKALIRNTLENSGGRINLPKEQNLDEYLQRLMQEREGSLFEKELSEKDAAFRSMKRNAVGKKMAVAFATGLVVGATAQQVIGWGKDIFHVDRGQTVLEKGARGIKKLFKNQDADLITTRTTLPGRTTTMSSKDYWSLYGRPSKEVVDWHDSPGKRYTEFFGKLINLELGRQTININRDALGVFVDTEKVLNNLTENAKNALEVLGKNGSGEVDPKLDHLTKSLAEWEKAGTLKQHLKFAIFPTGESRKALSMELSVGPDNRIHFPKEISELLSDPKSMRDGRLPFGKGQLYIDTPEGRHVLATVRGHEYKGDLTVTTSPSVVETKFAPAEADVDAPNFIPVTGRRPLKKARPGEAGDIEEDFNGYEIKSRELEKNQESLYKLWEKITEHYNAFKAAGVLGRGDIAPILERVNTIFDYINGKKSNPEAIQLEKEFELKHGSDTKESFLKFLFQELIVAEGVLAKKVEELNGAQAKKEKTNLDAEINKSVKELKERKDFTAELKSIWPRFIAHSLLTRHEFKVLIPDQQREVVNKLKEVLQNLKDNGYLRDKTNVVVGNVNGFQENSNSDRIYIGLAGLIPGKFRIERDGVTRTTLTKEALEIYEDLKHIIDEARENKTTDEDIVNMQRSLAREFRVKIEDGAYKNGVTEMTNEEKMRTLLDLDYLIKDLNKDGYSDKINDLSGIVLVDRKKAEPTIVRNKLYLPTWAVNTEFYDKDILAGKIKESLGGKETKNAEFNKAFSEFMQDYPVLSGDKEEYEIFREEMNQYFKGQRSYKTKENDLKALREVFAKRVGKEKDMSKIDKAFLDEITFS